MEAVVVAWPCWSPLATAISHGVCQAEVTPHFKRAEPMNMFSMPVSPSARMLRFFGSLPCVDYAELVLNMQSSDRGRSFGSRISPVPTDDIITRLRFTRNVKRQWKGTDTWAQQHLCHATPLHQQPTCSPVALQGLPAEPL